MPYGSRYRTWETEYVPRLDGGFVTAASAEMLDPSAGYCSLLQDVDLKYEGFLSKRPGIDFPIAESVPSEGLRGIYEYKVAATKERFLIVTTSSGGFFTWNFQTETWASLADISWMGSQLNGEDFMLNAELSGAGNPSFAWDFQTFATLLVIADGNRPPLKWQGVGPLENLGGSPPVTTYLATYKNRLCLAGDPEQPNLLSISGVGDPEDWIQLGAPIPDESTAILIFIAPDDGYGITGTLNMGEAGLLVSKDNALFMVYGSTRANISVTQINASIGAAVHNTMAYHNGVAYFINRNGVFALGQGGQPERISLPIQKTFDERIDRDRLAQASAIIWNNRYIISLPETGGGFFPLIYYIDKQAWVSWTNPMFSDAAVVDDSVGEIYFIDSERDMVQRINRNALNDDGPDILPIIETLPLDAGQPQMLKEYGDLYLTTKIGNAPYSLRVAASVDGRDWYPLSTGAMVIDENYSSSPYGSPTDDPRQEGEDVTVRIPISLNNGRTTFSGRKIKFSIMPMFISTAAYDEEFPIVSLSYTYLIKEPR